MNRLINTKPVSWRLNVWRVYFIALLLIVFGFSCSIFLFNSLRDYDEWQSQSDFSRLSDNISEVVIQSIKSNMLIFQSVQALFSSGVGLDKEMCENYYTNYVSKLPGVYNLQWVPLVVYSGRQSYEESLKSSGITECFIKERLPDGRFVAAGIQNEYLPVAIAEPQDDQYIGFNVLSDPELSPILEQSRKSGDIMITGATQHFEKGKDQCFVRVFLPVYFNSGLSSEHDGKINAFKGFVIGVINVNEIMEELLKNFKTSGIDVYLSDKSVPEGEQFLFYYHGSETGMKSADISDRAEIRAKSSISFESMFEIGKRRWSIMCTPNEYFVAKHTIRMPILILGLVLTLGLAGYFVKLEYSEGAAKKELYERKRAESEVSVLNKQIEMILGFTKTGLDIIDEDLNVVYVDSEWKKVYGEYRGKKCYEYFMEKNGACKSCGVKRAIDTRQIVTAEEHLVKENNRPIEVISVPFQDEKGRWYVAEVNIDITDRKKLQKRIDSVQIFLHNLINALEDRIFVKDEKHRWILLNDSMCKMMGKEREELIGKSDYDIFPKEQADVFWEKDSLVFSTGQSDTNEENITWNDGTVHVILTTKSLFKDPLTGEKFVIGAIKDITWRKKHEAEIDEQRQRLKAILDNVPDMVWLKDKDGRFIIANESFGRACGIPAEQISGKTDFDLWPRENAEKYVNVDIDVMRSGKRMIVQEPLSDKEGKINFIETIKTPLYNVAGEIAGTTGIARDITLRKQQEQELEKHRQHLEELVKKRTGEVDEAYSKIVKELVERKKAEEALSESEKKFEHLVESMNEGFVVSDGEFKLIYVNTRFCEMLQRKKSDLIGRNMKEFIADDYQTIVEDQISQRKNAKNERFELEWMSFSGVRIHTLIAPKALLDEKGKLIGSVAVLTDISAIKKLELDLRNSNQELEQFAYVASHDLQEPLRMITSYIQLLQKKYSGKLDGEADQFIKYVVDGAAHMQRIIKDLLEYSKLGRGGHDQLSAIDPNKILTSVLVNLNVAVKEANAVVEKSAELPVVYADETEFTMLLQNLINNAIKFSRDGVSPVVKIDARKKGLEWVFSVSDNGIGIERKYFDKIFKLFQRLHSRDKYYGTGIGLSICKKIVETHNGRIWVDSNVGQGSVFYFTIPVRG